MDRLKRNFKWYSLGFMALVTFLICSAVWADSNTKLKVAFLDVGQGDAIYIESPSGHQMIIDGGPPGALLPALTKVMPFYDRSIDVIVVTNPDQDHFAGFLDLLDSYQVGAVLESGAAGKSKIYQRLENLISEKKIPKILAKKGMKVDLGDEVYFDVLFPDRDVKSWEPNDASIVGKLTYGETSMMLTGDATKKTEGLIMASSTPGVGCKDTRCFPGLKSNILKVGHHGSKTSTSEFFARAVVPEYAVISDGADNKYGHPHQATLETLEKISAKVLRTDQLGTIMFESDGIRLLQLF